MITYPSFAMPASAPSCIALDELHFAEQWRAVAFAARVGVALCRILSRINPHGGGLEICVEPVGDLWTAVVPLRARSARAAMLVDCIATVVADVGGVICADCEAGWGNGFAFWTQSDIDRSPSELAQVEVALRDKGTTWVHSKGPHQPIKVGRLTRPAAKG